MKAIARIETEFGDKFGIPRQSGIVPALTGKIVFEEAFRNPDALRGLENFSHIWLIWKFEEPQKNDWSPTVRPPRLGGNQRIGVFASRSPNRPNPIGLSCVRLLRIELHTQEGPVLYVSGADLMNRTEILDIKPYIPYTDLQPEATGGYAKESPEVKLQVVIPDELSDRVPKGKEEVLRSVLSLDPRPAYQKDTNRVYGMDFSGVNVRFIVNDDVATVISVEPL